MANKRPRYGTNDSIAGDLREIGKHLGLTKKREQGNIGSKNKNNREALEAAGELESGVGIRRDSKVRGR